MERKALVLENEQQERAENFKDLREEFSGFLNRKKMSVIKTTLEECYYKRCMDRNIGGHRWRPWVEAL